MEWQYQQRHWLYGSQLFVRICSCDCFFWFREQRACEENTMCLRLDPSLSISSILIFLNILLTIFQQQFSSAAFDFSSFWGFVEFTYCRSLGSHDDHLTSFEAKLFDQVCVLGWGCVDLASKWFWSVFCCQIIAFFFFWARSMALIKISESGVDLSLRTHIEWFPVSASVCFVYSVQWMC